MERLTSRAYCIFLVASVLVLALGVGGYGLTEKDIDALRDVVNTYLNIDREYYDVIQTNYQGHDMILTVFYVDEQILDSNLDHETKAVLGKYVGKDAFYISALSGDKTTKFHPYAVRVLQGEEKWSIGSVEGITEGFSDGAMPVKQRVRGEQFWGCKGIVVVSGQIEKAEPFSVQYGPEKVNFSLTLKPGVSTEEAPQVPQGEGEVKPVTPQKSSSSGSDTVSKITHGITLGFEFVTLLFLTLML